MTPEPAAAGAHASTLADLSEEELTVAAIERLMRNGATALGSEVMDRYREGWFNALGFMAGLLGHEALAQVGFDLGHYDNDGAAVHAKAEATFGPSEQWHREQWATPERS